MVRVSTIYVSLCAYFLCDVIQVLLDFDRRDIVLHYVRRVGFRLVIHNLVG
jgi:hypothetical protein